MGRSSKPLGLSHAQPKPPLEAIRRLVKKLKGVHVPNGCWFWTGYKDSKGYGQIKVQGQARWAHRIAYAHWKGPIPEGETVQHGCFNPSCCNPAHLALMSRSANSSEAASRRGDKPSIEQETFVCVHCHGAITEEGLKGLVRCLNCGRTSSSVLPSEDTQVPEDIPV